MKKKDIKKMFTILCLWILLAFIFILDIEAQVFELQWGGTGDGPGQFNNPVGIALDGSENVYVVDSGNNRVQKFDSRGTFITTWGTGGSENGQFISPQGICVSRGLVYVVESGNNRVQVFDTIGTFIKAWGTAGSGNGQFNNPHGVTGDTYIYVTDVLNNRVEVFDTIGTFITAWGTAGSGNGQFNSPRAIAASAGYVYVSDENDRIQRFDADGNYISTWGTSGREDGQLTDPMGIALYGNELYVSEFGNHRVQRIHAGTNPFIMKWGVFGKREGQFDRPYGLAATRVAIYVVDSGNNRIQKFSSPSKTYNAAGTWTLSWTNRHVVEENGFECQAPADSTIPITIAQTEGTIFDTAIRGHVSATINGKSYSGFISSTTYNLSLADTISPDRILTEQITVTLTSPTAGSGNSYSAVIDNMGSYCIAEGDVAITKQPPEARIDTPAGNETITSGAAVWFTGTCTNPVGTPNSDFTFRWQFGPESGIDDYLIEDPGYIVFPRSGTFNVTFTCTDVTGVSDPTPDTKIITVNPQSGGGGGGGGGGGCFISTISPYL